MRRIISSSPISAFVVLTFALSSIFCALIIASGQVAGAGGMYATGIMWCPACAALLLSRGDKLHQLGWKWGQSRWQLLAYALPLGFATIAYAIVWLTGMGGVGNPEFIRSALAKMHLSQLSPALNVWLYVVLLAIYGVIRSMANALGEEIGWRGFLTPLLVARYGFTRGSLTVGLIWAIYHLPVLLFADYNAGTPWWFSLPCFFALVIAESLIMAWLRLRSGSLWTGVVLHASHNLFIQQFFTPFTIAKGAITAYAIDEFGFVLPLVVIVVAVLFWRRRNSLPPVAASV